MFNVTSCVFLYLLNDLCSLTTVCFCCAESALFFSHGKGGQREFTCVQLHIQCQEKQEIATTEFLVTMAKNGKLFAFDEYLYLKKY